MLNKIIEWSVTYKWLVILFGLITFFYGLYASIKIPIDIFPDFSPVQVVIQTEAPGFSPDEVENQVTIPLEINLSSIPNVQNTRSISTTGISVITILFEEGTEIFRARQFVAEKIQLAKSKLPSGVDEPVLAPISSAVGDIIKIGLVAKKSTSLQDLRTYADWTIKTSLMAVNGVSNIVIHGGDIKQYQVLIDPVKLSTYGITLDQVIETIQNSNQNTPGGFIRTEDKEYLIKGLGRVETVKDIKNTVITASNGTPVLIANIADIVIGNEPKIGEALINGQEGIILTISKQPWANTLELTHIIEGKLEEIKSSLPKDVEIITVFRQADFIETGVHNVIEALFIGGILVIVVLYVFLNNWRTAFISLTAIPLSLLTAVIILKVQGATINTMTLGGLAIAIGEVVDDAIIDVENIYRRLKENKQLGSPKTVFQVIIQASQEIRNSVVYATLIIALVFLPIFALSGIEGKIFGPLAFAFVIAILASLVVALTITPAMCYLFFSKSKNLPDEETSFLKFIKSHYSKVLNFSLNHPKKVIVFAVILFIMSLIPLGVVGKTFLPEFDESNLIVGVNSIPGTSLTITTNIGKALTQHMIDHDSVLAVGQRAGRAPGSDDYGGSNFSEYDIRLSGGSAAKYSIIQHIREDFSKVPGIVINLGSYISHRMDHILSGVNAAIAIKIFGSDLDILYAKADEIERIIKNVPGTVDVQIEPIIPIPQISIKIDRAKAAQYGLQVADVSKYIQAGFKGLAVSKVLEEQKFFNLVIWFKPEFRKNIEDVMNTLIDTPDGNKIPIRNIAVVEYSTTPNTIKHDNSSRRVVVQANVSGRDLGSVIAEIRKKINTGVNLPNGYLINYGGQFEAQEQATQQLIFLTVLVVIGIYILLVMAFRSMFSALLVMVNLPLALIGGIWAIVLSGGVLSVGSLVGFITLFGISTRNGIMIVSHFKHLLEEGRSFQDALWEGSLNRLSPVLMTALTAGFGVLPIAIMGGAGRELEQPLAVVIVGGMFSSTLLTLLVIPALFKIFGHKIFKNDITQN